jgi:hypothetical protein
MTKAQKIKQVLVGLALIAISIVGAKVANDSTSACRTIPMGLYAIFTKDKVVM